jgi:hypothetical protein
MVLEPIDPYLARRMEKSRRLERLGTYEFEMQLNGSPSEPSPGELFSRRYHHLAIKHAPAGTRYFKVLYREHTIYDPQECRNVTQSVSTKLVFYKKRH